MLIDKKPRILHVIGNMGLGGAQSLLYHLWPHLTSSNQYEIEICSLHHLGHFGEKLVSEGATIHCLHCNDRVSRLQIVPRLGSLIAKGNYSLIHAHLFPELYIVALATACNHKIPLVYTEHNAHNRRRRYPIVFRGVDKIAYRKYKKIVAVNESTRQSLVKWIPELRNKVEIIKNGVRTDFLYENRQAFRQQLIYELSATLDENSKILLFAGRLCEAKGVDILIDAFIKVLEINPMAVLLIAGDGSDKDLLQRQTQTLGINDRVLFLGVRPDALDLLMSADLMILPSRWEGLPIVMLEAMAVGCPIVATSVDGIAEVLCDAYSALLVPTEDSQALAAAINLALDDPELCRQIADRSLEIVKDRYSAEKASRHLLDVYDGVLNGESD